MTPENITTQGTTHVIFEPEDLIARLAALVPKPRAHLTRYHGVFAPASPDRASIEGPAVIERILEHLGGDAESVDPAHPSRAPPDRDSLL